MLTYFHTVLQLDLAGASAPDLVIAIEVSPFVVLWGAYFNHGGPTLIQVIPEPIKLHSIGSKGSSPRNTSTVPKVLIS